ncbi:stage III sporulation protein AH [Melghiribacillus thermohalophilus]|uniref:Stage III sporulation protein AH n=1 Tax=Melghiribacillus thermohalophilus TaxID=1324956 RepID=A0A4R3N6A6_9BACI|nr:SpoIIIAH-like family protein [Melghiribacillus thermohalophilus]TCT22623.1 stage III sporulation protein AH [Melghiribacillus thermohalophilus]
MLKKQTVWLLTMLSLLIVLSVYYMTAPEGDEVAFINEENQGEETETNQQLDSTDMNDLEDMTSENEEGMISEISTDDLFTSIRMEIEAERDQLKEQLSEIVASKNVSPEEKNEAMEKMKQLQETATKESILQQSIMAEKDYQDVLVRAEEDVVHVTVKANELSKTDANHIMQMVRDEFGEVVVNVKYQPIE